MERLRIFLEMPILLTVLTAAFTIGFHTVAYNKTASTNSSASTHDDSPMRKEPRAAILAYCSGCHQSGRSGIDFTDETLTLEDMQRNHSTWEDAVRRLREHEMPPRRFPQPSEAVREAMIVWIEQSIRKAPDESSRPRRYARRLQRSEYVNSIHDLLGVHFEPATDFPKDTAVWSQTQDKDALASVRAKYRAATEKILEQAVTDKTDGSLDSKRDAFPVHLCASNCGTRIDVEKTRSVLARFLREAYRAPTVPAEVDHLVSLVETAQEQGKSLEDSLKVALREVLNSEKFLYLVDRTVHPTSQDRQLTLASRLSFFLWRSAPDEELLAHAEQEVLEQDLEAEVRRMLQDPRARRFAAEFAASWLGLGSLKDAPVGDPLQQAMRQETELFVVAVLSEDRSVLEFLDADFTYLNGPLAKHYGVSGVNGDEMRRVKLPGGQRGGLVTQASVLQLTSISHRTSPVNRGKWVLEKLLGAPPIKPPASLNFDDIRTSFPAGMTVPQQMEAHRANSSCAQCHTKMDALGFALENYDPTGAWRTTWGKDPIVPVATLEDGEILNGPDGLKAYLLKNRQQFIKGLAEKMLQFALGRKLDASDRQALAHIPDSAAKHQYRFSRVIQEVVQSEPFRRGFSNMTIHDATIGVSE